MKLVLAAAAAALIAGPALAQNMPSMPGMSAQDHAAMAGKVVEGTGVVTAVDAKGSKITLHHGPIPDLKWPAMTMSFAASAEVMKTAKAGETVKFSLDSVTKQVLTIQPQ